MHWIDISIMGLYLVGMTLAGMLARGKGEDAEDYFTALADIREELAPLGLFPKIYGASRNVYPSPMSRSMGAGEKAYRLAMGRQAASRDLVSIFDHGPDLEPANVQEQRNFYESWLKSLGT